MVSGKRRLGKDVHGGGVGADGGGVDPGDALLHGEVVDEVAGLEVVGGVEDEIDASIGGRVGDDGDKVGNVAGDEVGDVGVDGDAGVEAGDVAASGCGFGQAFAGVSLVEEDLALEVGRFDEVTVDEGKAPDAGAGEQRGRGCAHGSAAYDGDMRTSEPLLAELADAGEEDLARVAVLIRYGIWLGLVVGRLFARSCGVCFGVFV